MEMLAMKFWSMAVGICPFSQKSISKLYLPGRIKIPKQQNQHQTEKKAKNAKLNQGKKRSNTKNISTKTQLYKLCSYGQPCISHQDLQGCLT